MKERPATFVCVVCHQEQPMSMNCAAWDSAHKHCVNNGTTAGPCCEQIMAWEYLDALVNGSD